MNADQFCDAIRVTILPDDDNTNLMISTVRLTDEAIAVDEESGMGETFNLDPTKPYETIVLSVSRAGSKVVSQHRYTTIDEARAAHTKLVNDRELA